MTLPKAIYDEAKELTIKKIYLSFSGGHDEGFLDINFDFPPQTNEPFKRVEAFHDKVKTWAYEAFQYSGAGDGSEYGDDFVYDLVEGTFSAKEWWYARKEGEESVTIMSVDSNPKPSSN